MPKISIVTGAGPDLGTGHLQRMVLLADFLQKEESYEVAICTDAPLPDRLKTFACSEPAGDTDLIIRDKRDSGEEEIKKLQNTAPVLALDDMGDGSLRADFSIDLLPPPPGMGSGRNYQPACFLYGYNFASSLEQFKNRQLERSLDILIYPGSRPSKSLLEKLRRLVPQHLSAAFFYDDSFQLIQGNRPAPEVTLSLGPLLHSTRLLMTHFGITLYEGHAAGTSLAVLDPGEYHNSLTRQLEWESLVNLGLRDSITATDTVERLKGLLDSTGSLPGEPGKTLSAIHDNCRNFLHYIKDTILN